jgi:hypothetical protein
MKKLAVAAVAGFASLFIVGPVAAAPVAPGSVSVAKSEAGSSLVQNVHYRHYRRHRHYHGFYGYRPSYHYGRRYYYGGYPAYGYVRPYYGPSFSITIGRGWGHRHRYW